MPQYAKGTKVVVEKTQIEVQKVLKQYGAINVAYAERTEDDGNETAVILFMMKKRQYRITMAYPDVTQFRYSGNHIMRSPQQMRDARKQELRRLWRALFMVVKAKLEAAQSGIVTFEEEFLAHIVLANNETVGEWIQPQLQQRTTPLLLPEISSARDDETPNF